jgi:hypothetical protein
MSLPTASWAFPQVTATPGKKRSFAKEELLLTHCSLWGIYLVTEAITKIDDLVHFTLREWSRLSQSVSEAEVERAKAQLKASILLSLDGTTAVAEDIGRQIITTGRRLSPWEVEQQVGAITAKDVVRFANERLWDKDIAISAVGQIEGLLDYNRVRNDMSRNVSWGTVLKKWSNCTDTAFVARFEFLSAFAVHRCLLESQQCFLQTYQDSDIKGPGNFWR